MIYTEDIDEGLEFFTDLSNCNQYFAGFVIDSKPTNHCRAIQGLTGDVVFLIAPDLGAPRLEQFRWDDPVRDHAQKILFLGHKP